MIHVFFVPGMFGSTVEHVLRNYTKEYEKTAGTILSDGSLHSFVKEFHPCSINDLQNIPKNLHSKLITTPIYPFGMLKLPELLDHYSDFIQAGKCILIHSNSLIDSELNCLFQYHKISGGTKGNMGLGIFFNGIDSNVSQWNHSYQCWQDMQHWELREWFSLFYPQWITEWINSQYQVTDTWLTLSNVEILTSPKDSFLKIIDFCKLTPDDGLEEFSNSWKSKQQYVLDEFELLEQIILHTLNNQNFCWGSLNIIAEAIVQQRLRSKSYEIRCDGLNTFPTNSKTLYNLLEKV